MIFLSGGATTTRTTTVLGTLQTAATVIKTNTINYGCSIAEKAVYTA